MDAIAGLNDKQKEAVLATEGPVLILAGAGSGKTRALTHRIAYLIGEKGVRAQNILAVTFTNKAAQEMSDRVSRLLDSRSKLEIRNSSFTGASLPWLGTFHSICVRILRREAGNLSIKNDFTIYDEDDSIRAVKSAMRQLDISEKKYNPRAIRSFISSAKGELLNAKAYRQFANDHFTGIVADVYEVYDKILRSSSALDFDDLIGKTVLLFQNNPEVLKKYQQLFRYILVDEYQDTNHSQYIFLKLLAEAHKNIFVIGDDWQSIYSFRGAKFQNILDFEKDYPDAKVIYLEKNYRSRRPILDAAQSVIRNNEFRTDKILCAELGDGAPVTLVDATNKYDEVDFIIDEIRSLQSGESKSLNDFVILYRTNAQSRAFEETLIKRQIPYRIIGGTRFYERKEIKDLVSYLKLIKNPQDQMALARVINTPPRGIGKVTEEKIISLPEEERGTIAKYQDFSRLMQELRDTYAKGKRTDELIEEIMRKTGYKDLFTDNSIESQSRLENIEELKVAASSYDDLDSFLEAITLLSDTDEYEKNDEILTMMTIHAAKGLEFPVVFITGLEEGLFPHTMSLEDQYQLEEERRLLYVGMTRAMERLYLSFAREKFFYGRYEPCLPSRFVEELPNEELDIIQL